MYLPCSGLVGENLTSLKNEALKAWYKGPTLIEAIDGLEPPQRAVTQATRFVVSDVYKDTLSGMGVCVGGKVECKYSLKMKRTDSIQLAFCLRRINCSFSL